MNAKGRKINSAAFAVIAVAASAAVSNGQVPNLITYHGEITDNGCLAEGVYPMEFSIWNSFTEGTMLELIPVGDVQVNAGRFSVELPVDPSSLASTVRYLEVTIAGVTMSPREQITSSPYSLRTRGLWVDASKNVGIGISSPSARLDVAGDTRVRGDVLVNDRVGVGITDPNALFGQVTIAGSGAGIPFGLDVVWNDENFAAIFASNPGAGGVLYANSSSDASLSGGGVIVVGDQAGLNVAIDDNEIMARDGTSAASLYLNNEGGDVVVGGSVDVGRVIVNGPDSVSCPAGTEVIGGGCNIAGDAEIRANFPSGNGWECIAGDAVGFISVTAYAICARIK